MKISPRLTATNVSVCVLGGVEERGGSERLGPVGGEQRISQP